MDGRLGKCKVCGNVEMITFMSICRKCYEKQMREIKQRGGQWHMKNRQEPEK